MSEPWFTVKTYGMGVSPRNAKGWIATVVFASLMLVSPNVVVGVGAAPPSKWIAWCALTLVWIGLVFLKSDGNPWRWRWGRK